MFKTGEIAAAEQANEVCRNLAFGLAMVINLFNPSTLFVYGRLFELEETLFGTLLQETQQRALGPSFADCSIVRARGSKRQGAIAGIIEYLTDSLVPALAMESNGVFSHNGNGRPAQQAVLLLGTEN